MTICCREKVHLLKYDDFSWQDKLFSELMVNVNTEILVLRIRVRDGSGILLQKQLPNEAAVSVKDIANSPTLSLP
ncbi:MAG: hypothetical protein ABI263_09975 [Gelidibacter sp.]